jgi:hypothetical protein
MGNKSLVVLIDHPFLPGQRQHRLDIPFNIIDTVFTSRGHNSSVFIFCKHAPKFYHVDDNPLTEFQNLFSNRPIAAPKKDRVPYLNEQHGKVAGSCFVYKMILKDPSTLHALSELLKGGSEMPPTSRLRIRSYKPITPFDVQMKTLTNALSHDWQGNLPYSVRFQALRLALNGRLPPDSVAALLPELAQLIFKGASEASCADALRYLFEGKDQPHPADLADEYSTKALMEMVKTSVSSSLKDSSVYRTVKEHSHLALIHHVRITPSGLYLEGPTPEVI